MIIEYKFKKWIIYLTSSLLVLFIFLITFIFTFKFTKKYDSQIYEYNQEQLLITDKNIYKWLNNNGSVNVEYNNLIYYIHYSLFHKIDDLYIYATDLSIIDVNNTNIFIIIDNINIFQLLN